MAPRPWEPLLGAGDEASPVVVNEWQLRFLDEVVKGSRAAYLDAPVSAYVMGEGWRDLDGWPPSGSRPVDWYLHSGGRANSLFGDGLLSPEMPGEEPADTFVYDPLSPSAVSAATRAATTR